MFRIVPTLIVILISMGSRAQVEPDRFVTIELTTHRQATQQLWLAGDGLGEAYAKQQLELRGVCLRHSRAIKERLRVGLLAAIYHSRQRTTLTLIDGMDQTTVQHVSSYGSQGYRQYMGQWEPYTGRISITFDHRYFHRKRSSLWAEAKAGLLMKNNAMIGQGLVARIGAGDSLLYAVSTAWIGGAFYPTLGASLSYEYKLGEHGRLHIALESMLTLTNFNTHELTIGTREDWVSTAISGRSLTGGVSLGYTFAWEPKKRMLDRLYGDRPRRMPKEKAAPLPDAPSTSRTSGLVQPKYYLGLSLVHHRQMPLQMDFLELIPVSSRISMYFLGIKGSYARRIGGSQRLGLEAAILWHRHMARLEYHRQPSSSIYHARSPYSWNSADNHFLGRATGQVMLAWDLRFSQGPRHNIWAGAQAGVLSNSGSKPSVLGVEEQHPNSLSQMTVTAGFAQRIYPVVGPRVVFERSISSSGRLSFALESMISLIRFHSHTMAFTTSNTYHAEHSTRVLGALGVTVGYTFTGKAPHEKRMRFQ